MLFITGYAHNALLDSNPLKPGMQIMIKPFTIDALTARINAILTSA